MRLWEFALSLAPVALLCVAMAAAGVREGLAEARRVRAAEWRDGRRRDRRATVEAWRVLVAAGVDLDPETLGLTRADLAPGEWPGDGAR